MFLFLTQYCTQEADFWIHPVGRMPLMADLARISRNGPYFQKNMPYFWYTIKCHKTRISKIWLNLTDP